MPEAVLTPEQWDAVKAASIKGVPDNQLAESFGVEKNAIRQRRFLDPVWKAAVQANREQMANNGDVITKGLTKGAETASLAQKVASTISESAASISENNKLLANQLAQKGIQRAMTAIDGVAFENMADIERAVKIAVMAGNWNRPEVSVNQSFAFGGGQEDGQVVECETEIVEDSGQYGDCFGVDEGEG